MRCRAAARHPSSTGDAFTMTQFDHSTFISPFTWRYGSKEMRSVFSEEHKRLLLRRIWIALAKAEAKAGLVSDEQVAELEAHGKDIDIERASLIEAEIHHDLMAEIRTYAEQCPKAGSIIHLGATSMDILDNMDAIRLKEALGIIIDRTRDLLEDMEELERTLSSIRGKGMKGAVGTGASYAELVRGRGMSAMDLEKEVMDELGLECFDAATQIYTRKQDLRVVQALSGLCCTMYRFAADFRILMSPPIGEWSEPFGSRQVGSSAMPFKRNPINCEKVDSLTRYVSSLYMTAWQNGATTFLERTLDDSANRRLMLPQAFLATEEALVTLTKVVKGMTIHEGAVGRMMSSYGMFSATERLLMELGRRGADRQEMHEVIRQASLKAWAQVQEGGENDLDRTLMADKRILEYITPDEIASLLDADSYVGDAPRRTRIVAERIRRTLDRP